MFTPKGEFLHSIATDPCRGLFPLSISSTSDGHLLVGTLISFVLLTVYYEDGTVLNRDGNKGWEFKNVVKAIMNDIELDDSQALFSVLTLHMKRNGQIMVAGSGKTDHVITIGMGLYELMQVV